jgi:hypothetical protein
LVLLVPILVLVELQQLLSVTFAAWVGVAEVLFWVGGLYLIWRRPRRPPK